MTSDLLHRMARTLSSGLASTTAVPADDDEALYAGPADHLGVRITRRACCPEPRAPWHEFADAHFAQSPIAVWVASRGLGGPSTPSAGAWRRCSRRSPPSGRCYWLPRWWTR